MTESTRFHFDIDSHFKMLGLDWFEARQQDSLDVLVEQSWYNYRHPLEVLAAHPKVRSAILEYRDLTVDPAAAIEAGWDDVTAGRGLPKERGAK